MEVNLIDKFIILYIYSLIYYKYMKNCCNNLTNKIKKCKRNDNKIFSLPRRFSKKQCLSNKIKGFTMRSSWAPYKLCKKY